MPNTTRTQLIIDRIEEDHAVLEWTPPGSSGQRAASPVTFDVPRALLPPEAREGDVLNASFAVDADTTAARRDRIRKLEDELFRD